MNPETKNCQNCKNNFTIDQDDFAFYEKIKVPAPTFCPECRLVRRLLWRNMRSLHRRECGLCKKTVISMYSDDGVPVYCNECWTSDAWSPFSYAKEYDISKPFFTQLKELYNQVPRLFRYGYGNLINSDFTNYTKDNKNAYLAYSVTDCEDVMYSEVIDKSKNSLDCYGVQKLDGSSYNIDCEGNYNTHFALQSQTCIDSNFIYDCVNCQNCCLSSNLRNQQYVFMNQKLSKEAYNDAVANLHLETASGFTAARNAFDALMKDTAIHKYALIYASEHVTGDFIHHAKNIKHCFDINNAENLAYCMRDLDGVKDSYDLNGCAFGVESLYECASTNGNVYKNYFCIICTGARECEYCLSCRNCSNCFGCVGLTGASYCIFNKQYSKEEYFDKVEEIKHHMVSMPYEDEKGRVFSYGEFFPYDMSSYGYNETSAHDFFTLSEGEAKEKGFRWKPRDKRDYTITKNSVDLPDSIHDVDDGILNEVIGCPHDGNPNFQCTTAYRIVPNELQFYRQKNLPLPRYCPNCRHYQRLAYRNPMKLYHRACSNNCGNTFESTYAPDRQERVLCESCYQKEVL